MTVKHIYVEKKDGFNVEAKKLQDEFKDFLNITSLKKIRILNRYFVSDISDELFNKCIPLVFSEPPVDMIYFDVPNADYTLATEYLPGQFDQRADSCAQCISIISQVDKPPVSTAKIYLFYGDLSDDDKNKIEKFLINPVENRIASLEIPDSIDLVYPEPEKVKRIKNFSKSDGQKLLEEYGLSMDEADLKFCQEYFAKIDRDPTITEILLIDTYWSDHCRHTTFNTIIDSVEIEHENAKKAYNRYLDTRKKINRDDKNNTLMEVATICMRYLKAENKLPHLDESEEINACSVNIDVSVNGKTEEWLLMFKNETHNHPTEIEPFGGAATCIGGAIRDPLSGRSYVYQAMRITGASNPLLPASETLKGKLPQRKITQAAAAGYSSYGNQVGVATGLVKEIYHPGFTAKRMELGAVIAAGKKENVIRKTPRPGDVVLLVGGRTGRDGLGGATGSSQSHDVSSLSTRGAEVQKGNAPEERKLQRLFRNPEASRLIKRCNDFGAGGVSVAIGELADGLLIDLDKVPLKYSGLDGTEIAISESQERMAVVLDSKDTETFLRLAESENLEAAVIAEVTEEKYLRMLHKGDLIVDLDRSFLDTNGVNKHIDIKIKKAEEIKFEQQELKDILSDLNGCSQQGLADAFDSTISAGTVLAPFGGTYMATPIQTMVAKIPVYSGDTDTCSGMTYAYNPFIAEKDPYLAGYFAVLESLSKLIASGFDFDHIHLSFQEYFEKLGKDSEKWGKPLAALLGAFDAQMDFEVASIGGKDSMSGTFEDLNVPPTLVSFAVGVANTENIISPEFKEVGNDIVLVRPNVLKDGKPELSSQKECFKLVSDLIKEKKAISAYALGHGGISYAVYNMCIGNHIGAKINNLDSKYSAGFILELSEIPEAIAFDGDFILLGKTAKEYKLNDMPLEEMEKISGNVLENIFPYGNTDTNEEKIEEIRFDSPKIIKRKSALKPKALIPVFPGTNCEYDTQKALENAGADTDILVVRNLTGNDITETIDEIVKRMKTSNIIVLPGGFSGGDEPDGSAKFITSFFRNPKINEALDDFLYGRDGLMLGICNGFQALIKLGLLVNGKIEEFRDDSPTIAYNKIGRHQSRIVRTKVTSNLSPWLSSCNLGEVYTMPVSHGEGCFTANDEDIKRFIKQGQICAQYVDVSGNPTMNLPDNPNGSILAVESLCSPDGRILGKMGHSERKSSGIYKNIPFRNDQPLFEGGVNYFK